MCSNFRSTPQAGNRSCRCSTGTYPERPIRTLVDGQIVKSSLSPPLIRSGFACLEAAFEIPSLGFRQWQILQGRRRGLKSNTVYGGRQFNSYIMICGPGLFCSLCNNNETINRLVRACLSVWAAAKRDHSSLNSSRPRLVILPSKRPSRRANPPAPASPPQQG